MFKFIKNWFICRKVEKALGFCLYEWQKDFIFNQHCIPDNILRRRNNGKTTACILRLLLSDGLLDKKETVCADTWGLSDKDWIGTNREEMVYHTYFWATRDARMNFHQLRAFNIKLKNVQKLLNSNNIATRKIVYKF